MLSNLDKALTPDTREATQEAGIQWTSEDFGKNSEIPGRQPELTPLARNLLGIQNIDDVLNITGNYGGSEVSFAPNAFGGFVNGFTMMWSAQENASKIEAGYRSPQRSIDTPNGYWKSIYEWRLSAGDTIPINTTP